MDVIRSGWRARRHLAHGPIVSPAASDVSFFGNHKRRCREPALELPQGHLVGKSPQVFFFLLFFFFLWTESWAELVGKGGRVSSDWHPHRHAPGARLKTLSPEVGALADDVPTSLQFFEMF